MHGGLIPILSYEASVDISPFGEILNNCSILEIQNSVKKLSLLSSEELKNRSRNAWEDAQKKHTRKTFSDEYDKFVTEILLKWAK